MHPVFKPLVVTAMLVAIAPMANAAFLADRHVSKGMDCTICHVSSQDHAIKMNANDEESCVECHGGYDKLVKLTAPKEEGAGNPHAQHDGNLPCTECHKGHKQGVNYCIECHSWEFKVP